MGEQQPELNINEGPHLLPSKRKQSSGDADAEATKKRQVESCTDAAASATVNKRPSGGVEFDRKGKTIMEHDMGTGTLNVDMGKKIVTVKVGKGLLVADMDKGIVKIGIGERIMRYNVGEGKLIEEDDPSDDVKDSFDHDIEDDECAIGASPPVKNPFDDDEIEVAKCAIGAPPYKPIKFDW